MKRGKGWSERGGERETVMSGQEESDCPLAAGRKERRKESSGKRRCSILDINTHVRQHGAAERYNHNARRATGTCSAADLVLTWCFPFFGWRVLERD